MPEIAQLEAQVNERWGISQWDWTIGKCPEGWFFYCGTEHKCACGDADCYLDNKTTWRHKGYAPTLTEVLQAMLEIP